MGFCSMKPFCWVSPLTAAGSWGLSSSALPSPLVIKGVAGVSFCLGLMMGDFVVASLVLFLAPAKVFEGVVLLPAGEAALVFEINDLFGDDLRRVEPATPGLRLLDTEDDEVTVVVVVVVVVAEPVVFRLAVVVVVVEE